MGLIGFKPTAETASAMRIRQTFDKTCAEIRADPDLSDTGKDRSMATAWLKCSAALAEIRAAESDAVAARRSQLEGELFGVGATGPLAATDYRDAMDRAEQCAQPKDAMRLLDRTTRTQDEVLAKAIAGYAVEQGWSDVLNCYAATRPTAQNALAELQQIDADTTNSTGYLARGAIYTAPKPPELARYSDSMIANMAVQADPVSTSGPMQKAGGGPGFLAAVRAAGS